eukprot:scaffold106345_cov17-Tisochrysis_lutea.AAC.1
MHVMIKGDVCSGWAQQFWSDIFLVKDVYAVSGAQRWREGQDWGMHGEVSAFDLDERCSAMVKKRGGEQDWGILGREWKRLRLVMKKDGSRLI